MNKYDYTPKVYQEGVIKDIVDNINDIYDAITNNVFDLGKKSYFTSVNKAASNLVLRFPVIVDDSVPLKTAMTITRYMERKMVATLQILFSAINLDHNKDAFDFIGKVHKNLNSDEIMRFIDAMDDMHSNQEEYEFTAEQLKSITESMLESIRNDNILLEDFGSRIDIDKNSIKFKKSDIPEETIHIDKNKLRNSIKLSDGRVNINRKNNIRVSRIKGNSKGIYSDPTHVPKSNTPYNNNKNPYTDKTPTQKEDNEENINRMVMDVPKTVNQDDRKSSEAIPSLMIINFRNEDGTFVNKAIIGVKAKLIYVPQSDMIKHIIYKSDDTNSVFNMIRATTGEISMLKDFALAIDKAKLELSPKHRNSTSSLWKMLERRKMYNAINYVLSNPNGSGSAIATLVISSDTKNMLEKYTNFKCNPYNIYKIMREYSCLGFIICDDVNEKIYQLFDDNSARFDIVSYTNLDREDKSNYKKIINLLAGR